MAKQSNGKLWFEAGIDRSQLSRGVTAIHKDFSGLRTDAGRTGTAFSDMWRTAALGVGAYLTATAALDMGKQIVNLTRQRELMEKSFEVMLGGADAAAQKIQEVNEYAIFSPYTFDGVAKGVQTMSAFGVATEDLMPTLRMLGDVAAGNQQRFESLSLVYGQIQSAGRLMGQDLLQLINAGFNPLQIMSEQTGKSMLDLKKEMENGLISFDMVADAFKTATSEGGKFYGMTTKMADSIEAAKSTFESAWVEKQIEWGKAARDNIQTMYEFGTSVVENADEIAKVFGVLIAAVGSYKAAMIALSVYQTTYTAIVAKEAAALVAKNATMGITTSLEAAAVVVKGKITAATVAQTLATRAAATAQGAFNAVLSMNPLVFIIATLAAATAAIALFGGSAMDATAEIEALDAAVQDAEATMGATSQTDKLIERYETLRDKAGKTEEEMEELKTTTQQLADTMPDAIDAFDQFGVALDINTAKLNTYNEAQLRASRLSLENAVSQGEERLEELREQQKKEQAIFAQGAQKTITQGGGSSFAPAVTTTVAYTQEEQAEAAKGYQMLQAEIAKVEASLGKARYALEGLDPTVAATRAAEAAAAAEAQAEADAKAAKDKADKDAADRAAKLAGEAAQKAAKAEADARRDAYEQGLSDYETFQQGVERLAREHAERVAAYESEASSPQQLAQLTKGSEAQMAEEIEALHEKHETEKFLISERAKALKDEVAERVKLEKETSERLKAEYETYMQARKRIQEQFSKDEAKMYESDGTTLKSGFSEGNVEQLRSERDEALSQLDKELVSRSASFESWANTVLTMGLKQLKEALATAQKALDSDTGITEEERAILNAKISKLQKQIAEAEDSEWGDTLKVMNEITESVDNAVNSFDGLNDATKSALSAATNIAGGITAMITGIQALAVAGAEAIKGVERASVVLAVIGAAVQIISSIANLFSGRSETMRQTAEKNAELTHQEYLAQYEINQLYRERYEWTKKIGETEQQNAERQIEEAKRQLQELTSEQSELLKALQGEEYITGYSTEKTGLFGWGKGKTVENRASLAGMSYDEILELEAQGKLTEEAQKYLDAMRDAVEEGEDLAETLENAQEALREAVVGMGFDEVVTHAMDDLLDGTKTAAEAFDEIMQGAMTNMLNEMMSQDVRDWYEGFAAAGADGYTQAEKEYWQKRWEEMQAENEERKDAIEDITGEEFDTGVEQGQAEAGAITAIQEEAPGSIDGKLTALQITSSQTAANTALLVEGQSQTRVSILEMRDGMDVLNLNVKKIYDETKQIKENTSAIPGMAADIKKIVTNTGKL